MKQLSLLEELELAEPQLSDEERVRLIAAGVIDSLGLSPPIDAEVVASFQGIAGIELVDLEWAGCLVPESGKLLIKLRASDSSRRRRFTAFHEVGHTFLPGFAVISQYRCDPGPSRRAAPTEVLCDIAASELLLPTRHFEPDVAGSDFSVDAVDDLAAKYEASFEATALRFVDLWSEPALAIVLDVQNKPAERGSLRAEPKLRVSYAHASGSWPFIPRYKSASEAGLLVRALYDGAAEGASDLETLCSPPEQPVLCSAKNLRFIDNQGTVRDRVLAIFRNPS